jgi:putative membrane protein
LKTIYRLLISALGIMATAYLMKNYGISLSNDWTVLATLTIVLAVLNAFLKPILLFLTFPITLLTFGIFVFVVNAAVIYLAGALVSGFNVGGFFSAMLFGIFYSVILSALNWVTGLDED